MQIQTRNKTIWFTKRKVQDRYRTIGLVLTLIHLISIPVTNTSVNPARSTGPALFVGGWAIEQLWLFWVAPIAGAILGGSLYRALVAESPEAEAARPARPI
jgi:aquaporin Z